MIAAATMMRSNWGAPILSRVELFGVSAPPPRCGSPVRGVRQPPAPGLARRATLRRREEVLERDVQEGAVRLGEQLVAVAELGGDLDPAAALGADTRARPGAAG